MKPARSHITKVEAAERIGVSRRTIHTMIEDGRLPVDEHGRILLHAFEDFLASTAAQNAEEEQP